MKEYSWKSQVEMRALCAYIIESKNNLSSIKTTVRNSKNILT